MTLGKHVNADLRSGSYSMQDRVLAEVVRILYTQAQVAIPVSFITAVSIVLGMYETTPSPYLISWFLILFGVLAFRFGLSILYFKLSPVIEHAHYWYHLFVISTAMSALIWMTVTGFLLPHSHQVEMLIAFAISGIVSGAVLFFSASRLVTSLFICIVLPSFAVEMLFMASTPHRVVGVLTLIYLVVLLLASFRVNHSIIRSLRLKIANDDLITNLYSAKQKVEMMNQELELEIVERKAIERQLREREDQYRRVTNALPVLIAYLDTNLCFHFVNLAYEDWFNKSSAEIKGRTVKEIFGDAVDTEIRSYYPSLTEGKQVTYEVNLAMNQDQERFVSITLIPRMVDQTLVGITSLVSDVTRRINHLATHDTLTNLPNRSLLSTRLKRALSVAQKNGTKIALMFLDLDHFKNVNDTLGHDVGDQLLIGVVDRLKSCVRDGDTIARLGGDEFVVVLEGISETQRITDLAKKMCALLAQSFRLNDRDLFITTSIGISLYPDDGKTMHQLLRNADLAMYRAKEHGRNTFEYFTQGMNDLVQQKASIEMELRGALANNEFKLHYQPIFDLQKNKIIGLEALLRWHNPQLGNVPPKDFLRIAEETNLILPIGEWVIRNACLQILHWQRSGYPGLYACINLSVRQFIQKGFVDLVGKILQETGLDAKYLILDLNESIIMEDIELSVNVVKALKALDITISFDDFGTGYSSLGYLKRFPFDYIKIDQSFVSDFTLNPGDAAIVKSIITLAHNLDMRVVAEGVEKPEQFLFLKENGCDLAQGYLLSPPLSEVDLPIFLRQTRHEMTPDKVV